MKISKALKVKNRLVGEVARLRSILTRENSRREDSSSTVDMVATYAVLETTLSKLIALKSAIAKANIGVYPLLAEMEEAKSSIAYYKALPIRVGEEIESLNVWNKETGDISKISHTWSAYINQEQVDAKTKELQTQIEALQDQIDEYNATTSVECEE